MMGSLVEISKVFYNYISEKWGNYKVIEYIGEIGKTKVKYYKVKFKNSGNIIETSEKTILENRVIDIEAQKKETKKTYRQKKKEQKVQKYQAKRFVLNLGEEPRILALDLSTHSTGWSVFIKGKLEDYGYIYQPKTEKWDTKRINFMKNEIIKLFKQYKINTVAMEDIIKKNKIALYVLSKLQGVICDLLYKNNIRYALITPIEWKSEYDINREDNYKGKNSRIESKEKTVKCVDKDFNLNLKEQFENSPKDLSEPCYYDVADAIAIGFIALKSRIKK